MGSFLVPPFPLPLYSLTQPESGFSVKGWTAWVQIPALQVIVGQLLNQSVPLLPHL